MYISDPQLTDRQGSGIAPAIPLFRAEAFVLSLTILIGVLGYIRAGLIGQAVDWSGFLISFLPCAGMLALGLYTRTRMNRPRLSTFLITTGLYIGLSGVVAIFIYLLFPIEFQAVDHAIFAIDAALGYDWKQAVMTLADFPTLSHGLAYVYHSSLPQLFLLIAYLSFTGAHLRLHRFMVTATVTLIATKVIWFFLPSFGPGAYIDIPEQVQQSMGLVTNSAYGAELLRLASEGPDVIRPGEILGTIAMPSYHTIMMMLVLYYLWRTHLFWPAIVLNLGMLPAILTHGGHHLFDVITGVALFTVAAILATRVIPDGPEDETESAPETA